MNDDTQKLLEAFEPKETKSIALDRQVHAARYSPGGVMLVAGGYEGEIRRIDVSGEEPNELAPLQGHNGWVQALAFHPDGELLFSGDSWGQLQAWKFKDESPQPVWSHETAHDGWLREIAVSPDGKLIATCGRDQLVRVWSAADGKLLHELAGHQQDVYCVRFHPTDGSLLSGDDRGIVKRWSLPDGKCTREFDAASLYVLHRLQDVGGVRVLTLDAAGKTLAVAGTTPKNGGTVQGEPTVLLFDYASGELKHTLQIGAANQCYVHDVVLHPGGFVIAVTSGTPGSGQLAFQQPVDEKPFFLYTKMANCHSLSLHPDGRRFAVTATNKGSNGNGRQLDKDGKYAGNTSPIHLFEMPAANS